MTHAYLGLLALDVSYLAVGFALLAGLGVARRRRALLAHSGLAFLTGWMAVGVGVSLLLCAGVDAGVVQELVLAAVLAGVGIAVRSFFPALLHPVRPPDPGRLARALAISGGLLLVLALGTALVQAARSEADTTWDAWAFWLPKAKAIYFFHGLDTGAGGFTTFDNPEYPPLVPGLAATAFHFMGGAHAALLPLQLALLSIAFVASVIVLAWPHVPRSLLLPSLALLVLAPAFWDRIATVLPDQAVAYCIAIAAVTAVLWLERGERAWLVLAAMFLAAAALTKTEGVLLGVLLAACVIVASAWPEPQRVRTALVLLAGPLALVPWKAWLALHDQPLSSSLYSWTDLLHPGYLADRLDRLEYAARWMSGFLFDESHWLLVGPAVLAGLVLVSRRKTALALLTAAWLAVSFVGLAAVYWISPLDVHYYVETSANRVVATLPVVGGTLVPLLIGLALGQPLAEAPPARRDDASSRPARP